MRIKLLEKDDKIKDQMKATVDVSAEIKEMEENLMMIQKVLSQMRDMFIFLLSLVSV